MPPNMEERKQNSPDFTFLDFSLLEIDDGYVLWIYEFLVFSELFYLCGSSSSPPPTEVLKSALQSLPSESEACTLPYPSDPT